MYSVKASTAFQRDVRKLQKAYPRIKQDLEELLNRLESGHLDGSAIKGFGRSVFKVRVPSSDQRRGKRGGFRVLYYVVTKDGLIYLLTIYAKSRQEDIRVEEIESLIREIDVHINRV